MSLGAESPGSTLEGREILSGNPFASLGRMSSFAPSPDGSPDLAIYITEHPFTNPMFVVVPPTSQDRIEMINYCLGFDLWVVPKPIPDGLQEGLHLLKLRRN